MFHNDSTNEFFKNFLLKYCSDENLLSEYVIVTEEDTNKFLELKFNSDFTGIDGKELLNYKNAIIFYESIGLLKWNKDLGKFMIEPSKLAIKNIEYSTYKEAQEKAMVPVKS